jgi:hypothetical protein
VPTAAELQIIIEAQDRASAQLQQVGAQVQRLERQVQGVSRGGGILGGLGLGAGFQAVNAAIGGLGGVFRFITESIFDLNSQLERTVSTFESITGSAGAARDVVGALRREAAVTPFSDAEILAAGRALITVSDRSTESLLGLVRAAEQLAAVDPVQGFEGATQAIREALAGSFESLVNRFEVSRSAIQRWRQEGLSNLQIVQRAVESLGGSADLIERLGRTFEGRVSTIQSFGNELRRSLGAAVFERVNDLLGRFVNLIAQYGDRLLAWAEQVGVAIGALLQGLAQRFLGPLLALLDRLAPGLRAVLEEGLAQAPAAVEQLDRAQQQAAQSGETLEHQLGRVGVAAAELQFEANRVRRSYDDQIEPLQRQLRLLQQSADLQRVQNALATNRATLERLRLDQEIAALQEAAGGATDPNAPDLSLQQRVIALSLQERQLRREELGLTEQQRPAVQSLEQQIAALQEQQRAALEPLERQLAIRKEEIDWLQLQRDRQKLTTDELEAGVKRANDAWRTLKNDPETLDNARKRGQELADEWLKGFDDFVQNAGQRIWEGIYGTFKQWYEGGGKEKLQAQATQVGTDLATALGDALQAALGERLKAIFANPVVNALVGAGAAGLVPGGGALPVVSQVAAAQQGGLSVDFGPGSIVIGGVNDPAFGERLKAALTNFLQLFILTQGAATPGPAAAVQGAGR